VYPVELEYQRSEMQPQFANIATPSEIVVATHFTLELGDVTGSIHFCIPYSTLEPIRDVLYSTIQGDSAEPDRRWVNLLKQQIQSAEVDLVAELAKVERGAEADNAGADDDEQREGDVEPAEVQHQFLEEREGQRGGERRHPHRGDGEGRRAAGRYEA
jgi:hypothetical protein